MDMHIHREEKVACVSWKQRDGEVESEEGERSYRECRDNRVFAFVVV